MKFRAESVKETKCITLVPPVQSLGINVAISEKNKTLLETIPRSVYIVYMLLTSDTTKGDADFEWPSQLY